MMTFPIILRKATHSCTSKPLYPLVNYVSSHHFSLSYPAFPTSLDSITIMKIVDTALAHLEWHLVIEEEFVVLEKKLDLNLIPFPLGKYLVNCHWVYVVKYKLDGSLEWYKARLVAKDYTQ